MSTTSRTRPTSAAPSAKSSNRDRISRRQVDKFAERRSELAAAALQTLAELGYARTSLREIAQNSGFSHGVLHYYFADKVELILYCVKQYKAHCVQRYDEIVATSTTPDELCRGFAHALAETARDDAAMHRLWYDLRSQSMFTPELQADVLDIDGSLLQMIWRVVSRYAELAERPVSLDESATYAAFDGLFQQALLRHLTGDGDALTELTDRAEKLLPKLVD